MLMRKEGNLTSLGKQGALCTHYERSQVLLVQAARGTGSGKDRDKLESWALRIQESCG